MFKLGWTSAIIAASAVLASAGAAQAQPTTASESAAPAAASNSNAALPWYQRFTSSTGLTETMGADGQQATLPPAWTMSQRWGVTVDVRDARRVEEGAIGGTAPSQASVGAFYQFTPRVRVGGAVSVGASQPGLSQAAPASSADEADAAGVRIESAFRF